MLYSSAMFLLGFAMMAVVALLMYRGAVTEIGKELAAICIFPLTLGLRMHANLEKREAWLARLALAAEHGDHQLVDRILREGPSGQIVAGLMSGMKALRRGAA